MYIIKNKANKANTFIYPLTIQIIISQQAKTLTKKTEILQHGLKEFQHKKEKSLNQPT